MSFSLSASGHHNDPEKAAEIDSIVADKLRELVAAVDAVDPECLYSAYMSGPTVSIDLPRMRAEAGTPAPEEVVDEAPADGADDATP